MPDEEVVDATDEAPDGAEQEQQDDEQEEQEEELSLDDLKSELDRLRGAKEDTVQSRNKYKEQLREAKQALNEIKAKEREREIKLAKKEQRFNDLEKMLKEELAERDRMIAEIQQKEEERVRRDRRTRLLDGLKRKTGKSDFYLRGALAALADDGVDVEPEEVGPEVVDSIYRRLKLADPDQFKAQQRGGTPGTPGLTLANKASEELDPDLEARRAQVIERAKQGFK